MKYPIGLSIILNALAAISILSGCSDYLDREYDSFIDNEMTFTSYERTSKFLVNAYRYLPDGFNRIGSEAMLDAATDDAEHANASCNIQHFNTGAWNSRSNPDDLWNKYYAGIRIANEFIENVDRVNLDKYRLDPDNQNEYQNRLNDLNAIHIRQAQIQQDDFRIVRCGLRNGCRAIGRYHITIIICFQCGCNEISYRWVILNH